jgi:hypothetical protein
MALLDFPLLGIQNINNNNKCTIVNYNKCVQFISLLALNTCSYSCKNVHFKMGAANRKGKKSDTTCISSPVYQPVNRQKMEKMDFLKDP